MAGHSKWANIKHRKAAQDAKKGKTYAKFAREIMMAAKLGGGDPLGNFRLRTAIDRAKAEGLPNDNIQRAIEKGCGQSGSDQLESVIYEGYGPGGVAVFIETLTDNRNRTAGDIRSYFNKYQGNLGADGCVAWIFEECGLIQVSAETTGMDEDALFEKALAAGALDLSLNEGRSVYEIYTAPAALNNVCQSLNDQAVAVASAEVTRQPKTTVEVTDPDQATVLMKLLNAIEAHDDVQGLYANVEMADALMESLSV